MTDLITILGPTASGKTSVAVKLAAKIDAEIISADSRQVYKRMDLGTGKDLNDYNINGKDIPIENTEANPALISGKIQELMCGQQRTTNRYLIVSTLTP